MIKKTILILMLLFACIGCDQFTKSQAVSYLSESSPISLYGDFFRLHYVENTGVMMSIGGDLPEKLRFYIFTIAVGVVLFLMFIYVISRSHPKLQLIGLVLILGGGLSNLLDRLYHQGKVIDFLNIGIGSFRTGIFNIADIFIAVGILIILSDSIKKSRKPTDR